MSENLTPEMIDELCMMLRVHDLMQANPEIVDANPEMKKSIEEIKINLDKIMSQLSEEERNKVLEEHKAQLDYLREEGDAKE